MQKGINIIDNTIRELENLKKVLNRKKTNQVSTSDEINLIKATAYSWIKSYKPKFEVFKNIIDVSEVNNKYCKLLNYSENKSRRNSYIALLKILKISLIKLRSEIINSNISGELLVKEPALKPNFSILITDPKMIIILEKRWAEIENCLNCNAPLAATVMMGGLLESVLMAKINKLEDKNILFKQKSTPINSKTNKPKMLSEWMLKDFIDVSCEIKIISKPLADFSRIIRDYRNYIHPEKELRMSESIEIGDAKMFWDVTRNLIGQLI